MVKTTIGGLVGAVWLVGLAGCSVQAGAPEPTDRQSEQSSTYEPTAYARTTSFLTIAPRTGGGYDVTAANTGASTAHVTQLDFSKSGLDAATIALVTSAPPSELMLEGSVTSGTLFVTAAYRGMPGVTYASGATFYQAGGPVAHALNENVLRHLDAVDASAAAQPRVQVSWLEHEITDKGAIVAGHVTQSTKTLTAQQVFLALPYTWGPCEIFGHLCPSGQTASYTRDENLCSDYQGCVTQTMCPESVPYCGSGYVLAQWAGPEGGCPQYACDPAFIH